LPYPPPPTPPRTPPMPPPGFDIDPGKCKNGGRTHFIVAPHQLASHATLQTWELNVHLNTWLKGMHVVIDFPSLRHANHALHVSAVKPPDVAKLVAVTKHSAIIELLETAARDFQFEALGDVDSLEVICDLSNVRLFPPPPPSHVGNVEGQPGDEYERLHAGHNYPHPQIQIKSDQKRPPPPLLAQVPPVTPPVLLPSTGSGFLLLRFSLVGILAVGMTAILAQQHPGKTAQMAVHLRIFRAHCSRPWLGRILLVGGGRRPVSHKLLEAPYFGVANQESVADLDCGNEGVPTALPNDKFPLTEPVTHWGKAEPDVVTQDIQQVQPLAAELDGLEARSKGKIRTEGTRFVVRQGPTALESTLLLNDVHGLKQMQSLVSQTCNRLGVDLRCGFRMVLVDAAGVTSTVGKSCTMERIRNASQIELVPKDQLHHNRFACKQNLSSDNSMSEAAKGACHA